MLIGSSPLYIPPISGISLIVELQSALRLKTLYKNNSVVFIAPLRYRTAFGVQSVWYSGTVMSIGSPVDDLNQVTSSVHTFPQFCKKLFLPSGPFDSDGKYSRFISIQFSNNAAPLCFRSNSLYQPRRGI